MYSAYWRESVGGSQGTVLPNTRLRDGISFSPFSVNTSAFHGWPRLFIWRKDEYFWMFVCEIRPAVANRPDPQGYRYYSVSVSDEISMTTRLMWYLDEVRYGACLPQHKHVHTNQSGWWGELSASFMASSWGRELVPRFLIKEGLWRDLQPVSVHPDLSHMRAKHVSPLFVTQEPRRRT